MASAPLGGANVGELPTAERMEQRVGTYPVAVRRVLGILRGAELVAAPPNPDGSRRLTRLVERLTLLDVDLAVEREPVFARSHRSPGA